MPLIPHLHRPRGPPCALIVGGGRMWPCARRSASCPYGADICAVAPEFMRAALPGSLSGVTLLERRFEPGDIEGAALVVAATDDGELNAAVSELCRWENVPVNVVDDLEKCSFVFPALVQRGELSVGISTGGASPSAAQYVRRGVEQLVPEGFEGILDFLSAHRAEVKAALPPERRAAAFAALFERCLERGGPLSEAELRRVPGRRWAMSGRVYIVGGGCGGAGLLTLRAQGAHLPAAARWSMTTSSTRTSSPWRRGRRGSSTWASAPGTARPARRTSAPRSSPWRAEGLSVVRLKGGDPFVFGRGGEELLALRGSGHPLRGGAGHQLRAGRAGGGRHTADAPRAQPRLPRRHRPHGGHGGRPAGVFLPARLPAGHAGDTDGPRAAGAHRRAADGVRRRAGHAGGRALRRQLPLPRPPCAARWGTSPGAPPRRRWRPRR